MLLSCTEAVGIKLPTLPALWEVHSLGSARRRGEIRQRPAPAERGALGTRHSEVAQSSLAMALGWMEKQGIETATGHLGMNQVYV